MVELKYKPHISVEIAPCDCAGNYYDECEICNGNGPEIYFDCNGDCINDQDEDLVCDELEILGCDDELANNFNSDATENGFTT